MDENLISLLLLSPSVLIIAVCLCYMSIRHHLGDPVDDSFLGTVIFCSIFWPIVLPIGLIVLLGWSVHKLIGVLVKPKALFVPPQDADLTEAIDEVDQMLGKTNG